MNARRTPPADPAAGTGHGAGPWSVVVVEVPACVEEHLAALTAPGILGLESHPGPAGKVILSLYVDDGEQARAAAPIEWALSALGLVPADCRMRVELVTDGRWVERYQAALEPFALGRRFVIRPDGGSGRPGDAWAACTVLRLVPGRAFGTGEHPTTRLCAEELERYTDAGSRWVDLGCGSGLLAMVAHHCGATVVRAVDQDPEAVVVAREVLAANGLAGVVSVVRGSIRDLPAAAWDGVVSNIDSSFFLHQAEHLTALLRPRGVLIACGFLRGEQQAVARALGDAGLAVERRPAREEWAAIVARHPGGRP